MKVNILLCDTFPGLLPLEIPSYPFMFERLFRQIDPSIDYEIFDVQQNIFPTKYNNDDIYLISGSNAGAYDNIPWIKNLICFIRFAHSEQIRLAGICFGHQIIAQALGGKVEKASVGWGTGVRQSKIINQKAIKYFSEKSMNLLYNHHDQVIKLPEEATCFATSYFCPYEGFFIGDHILTFQGHPEYTHEYNQYLILGHAQEEPETLKKEALKSLSLPTNHLASAKWILKYE